MSRVSCARRGRKYGKGIPNKRGYGEKRRQERRLRKLGRWVGISPTIALQMFGASAARVGVQTAKEGK